MLPIKRLEKSNTAENLWLYILTLLDKRSCYGWEIPQLIDDTFGFRPGKITPYRVFYRLETDGFVKSEINMHRRVYKITAKGKQELKKARIFFKKILNQIDG